jgi:hypothetical protein
MSAASRDATTARRDALHIAVDTLLSYTAETCAGLYDTLGAPLPWEAYATRVTAVFAEELARVQSEAERPRPPWTLPEG